MDIKVHPILDHFRLRHPLEPQPGRSRGSHHENRRIIVRIVNTDAAQSGELVGVIRRNGVSVEGLRPEPGDDGWASAIDHDISETSHHASIVCLQTLAAVCVANDCLSGLEPLDRFDVGCTQPVQRELHPVQVSLIDRGPQRRGEFRTGGHEAGEDLNEAGLISAHSGDVCGAFAIKGGWETGRYTSNDSSSSAGSWTVFSKCSSLVMTCGTRNGGRRPLSEARRTVVRPHRVSQDWSSEK